MTKKKTVRPLKYKIQYLSTYIIFIFFFLVDAIIYFIYLECYANILYIYNTGWFINDFKLCMNIK